MQPSQILQLFPEKIRQMLIKSEIDYERLYEIRLRVGRPVFLNFDCGERFLSEADGNPYVVTESDLKQTLEFASGYSLYAFEEEIRQGYISVEGGHRIGVTGKVILDGDSIQGMKYISCINIRLSHEIRGCADNLMPYIQTKEQICHTLLISPPRCGKTTMLRDIIRQLSTGYEEFPGKTVGVVDERSELAGCYHGIPQNDLGPRTDILDACPKKKGMEMLVRSMSPEIIAIDELGCQEDYQAVDEVIHSGSRLIATVHGSSVEEIRKHPLFQKLCEEKVFQRYIVLGNNMRAGEVKAVYDGEGKLCKKPLEHV